MKFGHPQDSDWPIFVLMLIGVGLVLLTGCTDETSASSTRNPDTSSGLVRYESSEVVCFRAVMWEGLWCHWKGGANAPK
jgi:hypothetical protein